MAPSTVVVLEFDRTILCRVFTLNFVRALPFGWTKIVFSPIPTSLTASWNCSVEFSSSKNLDLNRQKVVDLLDEYQTRFRQRTTLSKKEDNFIQSCTSRISESKEASFSSKIPLPSIPNLIEDEGRKIRTLQFVTQCEIKFEFNKSLEVTMVIIGLKKAVEHARKELMTKLLNVPPTRTTTSSASFSTGETSSSTVRTCMSAALRQDYERLRSLRSMVFESTANRETPKSRTGPHEDLFTRDFENFARSMNRANKPTCETVVTPDAETCEAGSGEHPPQSPQQGRPVSCARPETNDKSTQICGQFFNCDGLHYAVALAEAQIKLRDAQQWVEHLERSAPAPHSQTFRPVSQSESESLYLDSQLHAFPSASTCTLVDLRLNESTASDPAQGPFCSQRSTHQASPCCNTIGCQSCEPPNVQIPCNSPRRPFDQPRLPQNYNLNGLQVQGDVFRECVQGPRIQGQVGHFVPAAAHASQQRINQARRVNKDFDGNATFAGFPHRE